MKWNKIKEKYPKAFDIGQKWWVSNVDNYELDITINASDRFLYDFFDEQGMYISAEIDTTMEAKFSPVIYSLTDNEPCEEIWRDEYLWRTRTEAEEQAFEKAFEILENKLK